MFSGLNEDLQDEIQTYTLGKPALDSRPSEYLGSNSSFLATSLILSLSLELGRVLLHNIYSTTTNIQRENRDVLHLSLSRNHEQLYGRSKLATCAQGRHCFWFHFSKVCPMPRSFPIVLRD